MSRVFITGLPKRITEARLRQHFAAAGEITDCVIIWAKPVAADATAASSGNPSAGSGSPKPRMAFIGFREPGAAEGAVKTFDQTFLDTSRLAVRLASSFQAIDLSRCRSRASKLKAARLQEEEELAQQQKA
eukprot:RCo049455